MLTPPAPLCLRAPLLWLLLPFMGGIAVAHFYPSLAPPALLALLGLALVLAAGAIGLSIRPGRKAFFGWALGLGLAAGLVGFAYLHLRQPHWGERSSRPPREVSVTLVMEKIYPLLPKARTITGYGLVVTANALEQELVGQRVYFSALHKLSVPPRRSARYTMRGVIESLPPPTAELDFNDYLANLGIQQKLTRGPILAEIAPPGWWAHVYAVTAERLKSILGHGLSRQPAAASLYLAMLLGEKAALSPEQQNAFMRSGTFHVFSVSGLHVGVIASAIYAVFSVLRVPRRVTIVLTLLILWFYVQVTGANFPALRAFIMISFFLGGRALRQPGNGLAALTAAALVTLLYDPRQLFSTGFQMSYSVVLALIVMAVPLGARWLERWRPFALLPRMNWHWLHYRIEEFGRWLLSATAICWVAFLASLPTSIGYFHLFSPGSLLANLLIIPLSSLAIISGFLSLLAGLSGLLSLSFLFNSAAVVIIFSMDWLLQASTKLPGVYYPAHVNETWVTPVALTLLSGLLLACHAGRWSRKYGGYWPPVVAGILLLFFGVTFG